MRDSQTLEQVAPFIDALRALIKPGLEGAELEGSVLLELPAVLTRASMNSSPRIRAEIFIEVLTEVVEKRLKGNNQRAARILFALGEWACVPHQKRYEAVAKLHDKGWTWEVNYRKEPLARTLKIIFLALYRAGDPDILRRDEQQQRSQIEGRKVTADRKRPVGGDYVINSCEWTYNFPRIAGEPREFLEVRQITALRDGVDAWRHSSRWWGKNKGLADLPDMSLFGAGELSIIHDSPVAPSSEPGRIIILEVKFPRPLQAGESATFTITKKRHVSVEEVVYVPGEVDRYGLLAVTVPVENFSVNVRFPRESIPAEIWHYEDLPEWLVPGEPSEESTLTADASGYVHYSWTGLLVAHSYGIAWR
jgi:hypothetical protein